MMLSTRWTRGALRPAESNLLTSASKPPPPLLQQPQLILTGVSAGNKDEGGAVVFIDKSRHTVVRKVGLVVREIGGGKVRWARKACAGHGWVSPLLSAAS